MRTISEDPTAATPPVFSESELQTLRKARRIMAQLPDRLDLGCKPNGQPIPVHCHMLARGFGAAFPHLAVCDGKVRSHTCHIRREFYNFDDFCENSMSKATGWPHSWLMTPEKNILDIAPMCVASEGGPILVSYGWMNPFSGMYDVEWTGRIEDGCYANFEDFQYPWFWHANDLVTQAVLRARDELDLYP